MLAGDVPAQAAWTALDTWRRIGITRYAAGTLLGRVWELRDNLGAYNATADARLSRTPGLRCAVTVVPN